GRGWPRSPRRRRAGRRSASRPRHGSGRPRGPARRPRPVPRTGAAAGPARRHRRRVARGHRLAVASAQYRTAPPDLAPARVRAPPSMYDRGADPVTDKASAMYARALLTVSLLFLALPAVARDAQAVGPEGEACSADYSASTSPDA